MASEVVNASAPRHGLPKHKKEARRIFANFAKVLKAGGTDREHVVRVDRTHCGHVVALPRSAPRILRGPRSPSTSNLHQKFLLAGGHGSTVDGRCAGQGLRGRAASAFESAGPRDLGYSPALTCGDYVFVAGQTAER